MVERESDGGRVTAISPDDRAVRRVRAVLLAVMVASVPVIAGCGALAEFGGSDGADGAGDGSPAETARTQTDTGGSLESKLTADPETVFERVEELVGVEVETYPEVRVSERTGTFNRSQPFYRQVVGLPDDRDELRGVDNVSYNYGDPSLTVNETFLREADAERVEAELVFEFARHLQLVQGMNADIERPPHLQTFWSTVIVTTNAYGERHLDGWESVPPSYEERTTDYRWAFVGGVRYHVYQWVDDQIGSPSGISRIYAGDLPATSEQLVHDTDEPALNLTIDLETNERWYREGGLFGTRGELGTRAILRTQLDEETATEAAAGWGEDRYVPIQSLDDDAVGAIWVHRWDSPAEADEFERAMTTYADRREAEDDGVTFDVRRIGPDATMVVTSTGNMTENTAVSYDDGRVNVTAGEMDDE